MLRQIAFIFMCALFFCSSGCAETINGPVQLTLKSYDTLSVNGSAKLNLVKSQNLDIQGDLDFSRLKIYGNAVINGNVRGSKGEFGSLKIQGALTADHVICDTLSVTGPTILSYVKVSGEATFIGPVSIKHGEFANLTAAADEVMLENVTATRVFIKETASQEAQILKLSGSTSIDEVTFESKMGKIVTEGTDVKVRNRP